MSLSIPPLTLSSVQPNTPLLGSLANVVAASNSSLGPKSRCKVYIGAEAHFQLEKEKVEGCFKADHISTQASDPSEATHFLLFVTDNFLKSKEHVLPLILKLADPHFKQRLFPILMDKGVSIFGIGDEKKYVEYWSQILANTNVNSSAYKEVKNIHENIAALIRAFRDMRMLSFEELASKDFRPIIETIEARTHLLENKRFFCLPETQTDFVIGQEENLEKLSSLFKKQPVVTVSGAQGMGKTTLGIEYAKQAQTYPSGIFWFDAKSVKTIEDSYQQFAQQLGMSVENARKEMTRMERCLFVYDNATPFFPIPQCRSQSAHILALGSDLRHPDVVLTGFSKEDAIQYVSQQLSCPAEEAVALAVCLNNSPALLAEAIAYIKQSKIPLQDYIKFYNTDPAQLLERQHAIQQKKQPTTTHKTSQLSKLDHSSETLERYEKMPVEELFRQIKEQGIQIFVSYNWGAKLQVDQLDQLFNQMGIQLLRDIRELRDFAGIKKFMKKVIREADYTFSVINSNYPKSFNCLFEVLNITKDPHWQNRVFPIVVPGTPLDDLTIRSYEQHWQQEVIRFQKAGGTPAEIELAQEGARKIGDYLRWVRDQQPEGFDDQLATKFQKSLASMLARQEKLQKKGIYREGIFHIPQGRNKDFIGRKKELADLEIALKSGQHSAITNTGTGGIGKTQLALEYAYRHESEYELIYWIRSETVQSIKSDLRMLGEEMGIAEEFLSDDKVIFTVKGELERRKGWLLVFDNAEDPKTLAEILPRRGGHVLVTSRNPNWDRVVPIQVFNKEDALLYFRKISGVSEQGDELELLAEDLGYLPLALTQAASYIKRHGISIAAYRAAFKKGQNNLFSEKEKGYPESVSTAWQISMAKIKEEDSNAEQLLNFCSLLAPDNIPTITLEAWLKEKYKKDVSSDVNEALRILESYSLINQKVEFDESGYKKSISIHRLIQAVTRKQCGKEDKANAIKLGAIVLNRELDDGAKKSEHTDTSFVNASILLKHAEEEKVFTQELASLTDKIGIFFLNAKQLKVAKIIFEKATRLYITVFGSENHLTIAERYHNLACKIFDQKGLGSDSYSFAIVCCKKAIEIKKQFYQTENHISIADTYLLLGDQEFETRDYSDAKISCETALKIRRICLPDENHIGYAENYEKLGRTYQKLWSENEAKQLYKKAHDIRLACLGKENHPSAADSFDILGDNLASLRCEAEARPLYCKALNIRLAWRNEETDPLWAAQSYDILGDKYKRLRFKTDAREMYEKAHRIRLKCIGTESDLRAADSYETLAKKLEGLGYKTEAKNADLKARNIRSVLGNAVKGEMSNNSQTLSVGSETQISSAVRNNNSPSGHKQIDPVDNAIEKFETLIKLKVQTLGENHPEIIESYREFGFRCLQEGAIENARKIFDRLLKILAVSNGTENSSEAKKLYRSIGERALYNGHLDYAKEMFERGLKSLAATLSTENHPDLAAFYQSIGEIALYEGHLDYAKEMFERGIKSLAVFHGTETHADVAAFYQSIGKKALETKHFDFAKDAFSKQMKIVVAIRKTEDHVEVANIYEFLGLVFEKQEDYLKAIELYEKEIKIRRSILGPEDLGKLAYRLIDTARVLLHTDYQENYDQMIREGIKILSTKKPDSLEDLCETYEKIHSIQEESGFKYFQVKEKLIEVREMCKVRRFLKSYGSELPGRPAGELFELIGDGYYLADQPKCAKEAIYAYERAIANLAKYEQSRPSYFPDLNCILSHKLGNVYKNIGNLAEAKKFYDIAKGVYLQIGFFDNAERRAKLGNAFLALGDLNSAEEMHNASAYSEPEELYELGRAFEQAGDLVKAKQMYKRAASRFAQTFNFTDNDRVKLYNKICAILKNLEDNEMIVKSLADIKNEYWGDDINAYLILGNFLKSIGDLKGAENIYLRPFFILVGNNYYIQADSLKDLSQAIKDLGVARESQDIFSRLIKGRDLYKCIQNRGVWYVIANTLFDLGDIRGAKEIYKALLELESSGEDKSLINIAYVNMSLGNVYLALKLPVEALEHYTNAQKGYRLVEGNSYDAFFNRKITECNALIPKSAPAHSHKG